MNNFIVSDKHGRATVFYLNDRHQLVFCGEEGTPAILADGVSDNFDMLYFSGEFHIVFSLPDGTVQYIKSQNGIWHKYTLLLASNPQKNDTDFCLKIISGRIYAFYCIHPKGKNLLVCHDIARQRPEAVLETGSGPFYVSPDGSDAADIYFNSPSGFFACAKLDIASCLVKHITKVYPLPAVAVSESQTHGMLCFASEGKLIIKSGADTYKTDLPSSDVDFVFCDNDYAYAVSGEKIYTYFAADGGVIKEKSDRIPPQTESCILIENSRRMPSFRKEGTFKPIIKLCSFSENFAARKDESTSETIRALKEEIDSIFKKYM